VLSWALIALGVAQIALAPLRDAGPIVYVLGALFVGLGVGRLWLAGRR
jgi:hypothetical protein